MTSLCMREHYHFRSGNIASSVLAECVVKLWCWSFCTVTLNSKSVIIKYVYTNEDMHLTLQNGTTALMLASNEGKVECVEMLLDRGADMNMQDKVSGVIIHCVHAMQHIPRVPRSGW